MPLPTLTLSLTPQGKLILNGPLRNKLLCMKMPAQAIVLVEEYREEPTIIRAETIPVVQRNQG